MLKDVSVAEMLLVQECRMLPGPLFARHVCPNFALHLVVFEHCT